MIEQARKIYESLYERGHGKQATIDRLMTVLHTSIPRATDLFNQVDIERNGAALENKLSDLFHEGIEITAVFKSLGDNHYVLGIQYDGKDDKGYHGTVELKFHQITDTGLVEDFELLDYTGKGYLHKPELD